MSKILSEIDVNNYALQSMVAGGADLQEKTATPTTSQQVIQADEGYDGLSSVTVNAVTSAIDENIIPTNIRTGKTILGVQGNLEPDKPDQSKTVTPSTVQQVIVADTGYELAQVTVEAVPDETPELNAQDTALSNQETVIGQLSSALDNKIALDLADATSDANATANDIVKNKTAYVNGIKLTGTYEGEKVVLPNGTKFRESTASDFSWLSNADTSNIINTQFMFDSCSNLTTIPQLDTSNATSMSYMFQRCSNLTTIPQLDISNATSMMGMFFGCGKLTTIPQLDTSKATYMDDMFAYCTRLTNESLDNILAMCINATAYERTKTLKAIGLSSTQATTCQTLSNWDAFVVAGWSTGYES